MVVLLVGLTTYNRMSVGPWIIGLVLLWPVVQFALAVACSSVCVVRDNFPYL